MKCPQCGAVSEVKDTRLHKDNYITRRRLCFNNHTFKTKEEAIMPKNNSKPLGFPEA